MPDSHLELLRSALLGEVGWHKPWTSGVIGLSGDSLNLSFKHQDGTTHQVNLASTLADAEGDDIMKTCQAATFGRGSEEVYDETYRKAGKLEANDFTWPFDPHDTGIATSIIEGLFPWGTLQNNIRFEPYKLNVYGKGSFFKSHMDTPRDRTMFGSLVISLPYPHKGGDLILHQQNQLPFIFNGPAFLHGHPPGSIAWVAFYSDIEHEVTEVTEGHRVTITFNLYFDLHQPPPSSLKANLSTTSIEHPFRDMLKRCLDDPDFVKEKRFLGFGLERLYPGMNQGWGGHYTYLDTLVPEHLKEPDTLIFQTLEDLGYKPQLRFLFRDGRQHGDDYWDDKDSGFRIMRNEIPVWDTADFDEPQPVVSCLMSTENKDARIVWLEPEGEDGSRWLEAYKENEEEFRPRTLPVTWVVEPNEGTVLTRGIAAYGNQAEVETLYYQMCLLVDLWERDERR